MRDHLQKVDAIQFFFYKRSILQVYEVIFSLVNNNGYLQRKAASDKQTLRPKNSQKMNEFGSMHIDDDLDDTHLNDDPAGQKPKRPKRTKKNVNEKFEVFPGTATIFPEQTQFPPSHNFNGVSKAETVQDL